MKVAPAAVARSSNSRFVTVPAPIFNPEPANRTAVWICSTAPGEFIVISRCVIPPFRRHSRICGKYASSIPRRIPISGTPSNAGLEPEGFN